MSSGNSAKSSEFASMGELLAEQGPLRGAPLPKELFCESDDCIKKGVTVKDVFPTPKFCEVCGKELSSRVGDIYVDLCYDQYSREERKDWDESPNVASGDEQKPETRRIVEHKVRISMRELVRVMKAYEKEVFVEDI